MSGNDHASSKCAGSDNGSLLVRMDLYVGHGIYHLITAQKTGDMPEQIRGFDENIYLSPIMLFEYFDLLDEYGALTGKAVILCGLGMVKFSFLLNFLLPKYLQNDDENKRFCCISFKM